MGYWAKPRVLHAGRTKNGIMHGKNKNNADKYFLSSIIPVNDEIQIRALEADQSLASNLMRQQVNFWLKVPVELSLNFIETNVKMNTV